MSLEFLPIWRKLIYEQLLSGVKAKTLIVNRQDLEEYEESLSKLYPGGIIPITDGVLKYKRIPIGYSDDLKRNECALETK